MVGLVLVALCTLTAATQAAAPTKKAIFDGERLPFSPRHFIDGDHHYHPQGTANRKDHHRELESNEEDFTSYLVDRNGNEYEPYSLAWRYLGMYMDCNVDYYESEYEGRFLGENGNGDCERVLLWAAYVDPRYRGGSIGEYQFYNLTTGEWDRSTCRTKRCARMDCHEPNTHFKLVGVFKETDGLVDWAEQLFKHEGYCVWDSSAYSFMQKQRENWPTSCFQASYSDSYGNTLFMDLLPQGEGNITIGMFTDESCTQVSTTTTFLDYVVIYYQNVYGSEDAGVKAALSWNYTFETWNEYMSTYKICQPCRSYNLNKFDQEDEEGRYLENNKNDGEGEEEQWGYNCYDDAGYTNCNQCYKFETKTDLEPTSMDDLGWASNQGTILEIRVNGTTFGSGGFRSPSDNLFTVVVLVVSMGMLVGGILFGIWRRYRYDRRLLAELPASLQESIDIAASFHDSLGTPTSFHGTLSIDNQQVRRID